MPKETLQKQEATVKSTKPFDILLHDMKGVAKENAMDKKKMIIAAVVIITLGLVSGFGLSRIKGSGTTIIGKDSIAQGKMEKIVGLKDVSGKDSAEGKLVPGGIEGEGTHHLERPGGPSQNVYLTSSVVPLDTYVDKKVKVYGETFAAQSAGWLMDVVRLELLE